VVPEGQRLQPWHSYRRGVGLEDAADDGAIRKQVEIIVIPLGGMPTLQEKHVPAIFIKTKLAGVPKHGLAVALHVLVDRVNRRALVALSI
jgi:hypothetical protein